MFFNFGSSSLSSNISAYFNNRKRVNTNLSAIQIQILSSFSSKTKINQIQKLLLSQIHGSLRKLMDEKPFFYLKMAMLTHTLLINADTPNKNPSLMGQSMKMIEILLSTILLSIQNNSGSLGKDYEYINENLTKPYIYYQQKKLQFIQMKISEVQQRQEEKEHKKEEGYNERNREQSGKERVERQSLQTKILALHYQQCYKSLNLVNKGLRTSKKLLSVYRYYFTDFMFLADFNILLAQDFSVLYKSVQEQYNAILQIQQQMGIQSIQYIQLIKEISQTNQGLFIIFLNRQCISYVSQLQPIWIETDNKNNKQLSKQNPEKNVETEQFRQKSKTLGRSTRETEVESPGINKKLMYGTKQQKQKQMQKLRVLNYLQQSFNKKFKNDALLGGQKVKRNRSFFQLTKASKISF